MSVAVLVAALLDVVALGARSAKRPADTGVLSALGDWVADLDKPEAE